MDTLWMSSSSMPAVVPHNTSANRRRPSGAPGWSLVVTAACPMPAGSGFLQDLGVVHQGLELVVAVDQAPAGHPGHRAVEVVLRVRAGVDVAEPAELEVARL